jgi:hypothetical protein
MPLPDLVASRSAKTLAVEGAASHGIDEGRCGKD